jgi:hypothetical protein
MIVRNGLPVIPIGREFSRDIWRDEVQLVRRREKEKKQAGRMMTRTEKGA